MQILKICESIATPFVFGLAIALAAHASAATVPVGTAFTYQGRLQNNGEPLTGLADFQFTLFDVAAGGAPVSSTLNLNGVSVNDGLFTVDLDFGVSAFGPNARWLDIAVRSPAGSGTFTPLAPRQAIRPTPVAQFALSADGASIMNLNASNITAGTLPNAALSGVYSGALNLSNGANTIAGTFTGSGAAITNLNAANIASGTLPIARGGTGATSAAAALANLGGIDSVIAGKNLTGGGTAGDVILSLENAIQLGSGSAPMASGGANFFNGVMSQASLELNGAAHRFSLYGNDGLEQIRLWGPSWGELWLNDSTDNNTTVFLSATSNSGGLMELRTGEGATSVRANGSTGFLHVSDGYRVSAVVTSGPVTGKFVNEVWGGRIYTQDETGLNTTLLGSSTSAGGFLYLYQSNGSTLGMDVDGDITGAGGGANLSMRQSGGNVGINLDADETNANGGGLLSVHNSSGVNRVRLDGQSVGTGGEISVLDADGTETIELLGAETSTTGGRLLLRNAAGNTTINLDADFGSGSTGRISADELHITNGTGVWIVDGNVGIGTSAPTFKLQLATNSAAKPTSNTWTISSDARLKKNIHTIEHALDDLLSLRGVTYQWINPQDQGEMDGTYTGMIAQEVERVFPEWVQEDAEGFKTLTVIGFEGLVIEALRDLRDEKNAELLALRQEHQAAIQQLRQEKDEELALLKEQIRLLEQQVHKALGTKP